MLRIITGWVRRGHKVKNINRATYLTNFLPISFIWLPLVLFHICLTIVVSLTCCSFALILPNFSALLVIDRIEIISDIFHDREAASFLVRIREILVKIK